MSRRERLVRGSPLIVVLLGLSVLGLCTACKKVAPPLTVDVTASDDPAVEAAYREGRALFEAGKLGLADETFAEIIRNHPADPLARPARIMRARVAIGFDNPKRARELLKDLKDGKDPVAERAVLYDGVALFHLGKFGKAIDQLTPFEGRLTDPDDNANLYGTLWQAAKAQGKVEAAVIYIDRFFLYGDGRSKTPALDTLEEMVASIEDISVLEKLAETLTAGGEPWKQIIKRLADIHLAAGRFDESASLLESLEKGGDLPPRRYHSVVESDQYPMQRDTVGLIVPLSGRSRLVGETVVKGVMLGAKRFGLQVVIRDSASDADRAESVVGELVKESRVVGIIGPVDGEVAARAAAAADPLGVPMLVLSLRDHVADTGSFVFREFLRNENEAAALVSTASGLGYRRFAVLSPDNGYGHRMTAIFKEELQRNELELVTAVTYPESTKTFTSYAETLSASSFEVLFIPDIPSRLALIAPALAAKGLWSAKGGEIPDAPGRPVQLLIPSVGFSEDLLRRAGRYLEGALFTSFFHTTEALPGAAEFSDQYHLEYGGTPNYLAAYGYDAVRLLAAALKSGATTRGDVRRWLLEASPGRFDASMMSTPFAGYSLNGEPKAAPRIFQIQNGGFELIRQ